MSAMPADAALFDLDGCLVDSRVPFARSINAALAAHGLEERPDEQLYPFLGPPIYETFLDMVGDEARAHSLVDAYRARYREHGARESQVFPGIPEALAELSQRMPLVVATSRAQALAEPLLEALGLRPYFQAIVGPELSAVNETKAQTIGRALTVVAGHDAVAMVGDRRFDIEGAHEHGLRGVGVLWGIGSADELRSAGADALVERPDQLPAAIDG
jgi:phosphoglycolate phosphatase